MLPFLEKTTFFLYPIGLLALLLPVCEFLAFYFDVIFQLLLFMVDTFFFLSKEKVDTTMIVIGRYEIIGVIPLVSLLDVLRVAVFDPECRCFAVCVVYCQVF